jgi:hypothetical protein
MLLPLLLLFLLLLSCSAAGGGAPAAVDSTPTTIGVTFVIVFGVVGDLACCFIALIRARMRKEHRHPRICFSWGPRGSCQQGFLGFLAVYSCALSFTFGSNT